MHGLHDRDRLQEVIIELLAVCNVTAIGCYPVCIICAVCCVVVIVYTVYVVIVMSVGIVGIVGVDTVSGSDTVTWIIAADIMGILVGWWESGGYIIILLPLELLLLFIIISYLRILAYYLLLLLFPLSLGLVARQCLLVRNCTIYIYLLIAADYLIAIADSIVDTVVADNIIVDNIIVDTVVAALLGLGCLYAEILDIEL